LSSLIPADTHDLDARIQKAVEYCADNSSYYRDKLREVGAEVGDIRSATDLERLPVLLTKEDEVESAAGSLASEGHPFGKHLCASIDDVVAVNSTSGTTGDPTYYAFTADDVALTDSLWAQAFRMGGVSAGDAVVHAFGLSMFLAGVPVVRALERMRARPIPVGAEAGSEKLIKVISSMQPKAICLTPSYAQHLTEKSDLSEMGIRHVFCAGEPGAGLPEVRAKISEGFGGASVTDVIGGCHGIMNASCDAHQGMHVLGGDHTIQQLIDPDTGEPVEIRDGAVGARVKTTLDWQAQPQLRSSIGDIYEIFVSPCACGRTEPRIKVIGRIDDLLIIKGVKLYPAAVQNMIHEFQPELTGSFKIVLREAGPRVEPPLRMKVELSEGSDPGVLDELAKRMHGRFAVTPSIEPVPAGTLVRTSHKARLIEVEG
jgi:phenylacetate-CoA ligase